VKHRPSYISVSDISSICSFQIKTAAKQHNHGTENDAEFKHYTGNEDPKGFMSIGFVSDNLEASGLH
jgi:hypothetical protein